MLTRKATGNGSCVSVEKTRYCTQTVVTTACFKKQIHKEKNQNKIYQKANNFCNRYWDCECLFSKYSLMYVVTYFKMKRYRFKRTKSRNVGSTTSPNRESHVT